MRNKNVTIHNIAAKLNISASTVSRALSDYSRISLATRELVKKTAFEMNYKPNQLASNLRKGKGNTIGVIIPRLNRHFFSHAIAGMEAITNPTDYNLMICQTNEDYESEKRSMQTFLKNRIDGIIISMATGTVKTDHIEAVINQGIPVVMFDRVPDKLEVDSVVNDNFAGAYDVTNHLINEGYQKIIHFSGPIHVNVYRDRLEGYKKAMKDAGLDVTDDMIYSDVLTRAKGEEIAEKIYQSGNIPDAIFSASDFSALGALLVFKSRGIAIPERLGIAGFANEPFTELTDPGITTLEQFSEEVGKTVARLMIEKIETGNKKIVSTSMNFRPKLIVRGSTLKNKKIN